MASPLTDKQWDDIKRRYVAGEKGRVLAREFGISETAIRKRFGSQNKTINLLANQMVEVETKFASLDSGSQLLALNLARTLLNTSGHLAGSAELGAMTSYRLMGIANSKAAKLNEKGLDIGALQEIAAITQVANDSTKTAFSLLNSNKAIVEREAEKAEKEVDLSNMSIDDIDKLIAASEKEIKALESNPGARSSTRHDQD